MSKEALTLNSEMFHTFSVLAGMGLFFVGIKLLKTQISHLTGPRFRAFLQKVTNDPPRAAIFGVVTGLFTQSGRVAAILLASLTSSGMMSAKDALPIIVWANVGCSLIVITTILPVHLVVLLIVGIAGTFFAFDFPKRATHLYGSLFSFGLFMLGLSFIKNDANFFVDNQVFGPVQSFIQTSTALAFILGVLLTCIIQSHMGVILIAITFAEAGIFSPSQIFMTIFGAHLGSSVVTWAFSIRSFTGAARHVLISQVLFNLVGVALFLPLFGLDDFLHPGHAHEWLAKALGEGVGQQAAGVTILFNFATACVLTICSRTYLATVFRFWPSAQADELGKPQFINRESIDQPETGILLAGKEQVRLFKRLALYLDSVRPAERVNPDARGVHAFDIEHHHTAYRQVADAVQSHLAQIMLRSSDAQTSERLLNLQNRQDPLRSLEADAYSLYEMLKDEPSHPDLQPLISNIVEALDTVLLTMISLLETGDEGDLEQLSSMTSDKGDLIRSLRRRYLATEANLSPSDRSIILKATNLFERMIWTMGRVGKLASEQRLMLE